MEKKRDYDEFTLKIGSGNSIEPKIKTRTELETLGPEAKVSENSDLRDDIDKGITALRAGKLEGKDEDIKRLGRNLYRAIFPEDVGSFFEQALRTVLNDRRAGNRNRWLRVIIDVHPESAVFGWPLEFLYCPSMELWLATERSFIALSRHLTLGGTIDLKYARPPLRALVVICDPDELGGVITTKVLEEISKLASPNSMAGAGEEKRMTVKVLGRVKDYQKEKIPDIEYLDQPARYAHLMELIREWNPHVLHFVGHGKWEEAEKEGYLALMQDDETHADWIKADHISQLFSSEKKPRLVLLQACQSASSGTEPAFMSLADRIFKRNIPAVVAMQFSITNNYASKFAQGFYEALRNGKDVDEAVQIGRSKITTQVRWSNRDFGAPVLFTYRPDAIIQPLPPQSQRSFTQALQQPKGDFTFIQKVADKIQRALIYLGETGGPVNVEAAIDWIDDVLIDDMVNIREEVALNIDNIKNRLIDAKELLASPDGMEGAIRRLNGVLKSIEAKPTLEPKSNKWLDSEQGQLKLEPVGLTDRPSQLSLRKESGFKDGKHEKR